MPLIKTAALNLTDVEIRYAMANSRSNAEAARFIGCYIGTYKKYASRYIDPGTGLSLWELHKNQCAAGIPKFFKNHRLRIDIFDVLDGKHPNYNKRKLHRRLIHEIIFPEECSACGFCEHRITDDRVPLVLVWKDGNKKNHRKDNLEFLCYNCYFLMQGDLLNDNDTIKKGVNVYVKEE